MIPLFPEKGRSGPAAPLALPKVVVDLRTAETFQQQLDSGAVKNRADLARRYRLTRARVTQLMSLLNLHPKIREYVGSLPPGTPTRRVTERALRAIVRLWPVEQLEAARRLVWGFRAFVAPHAAHVA